MADALIHTYWLGSFRAASPTVTLSEPGVMAGLEWTQPTDARIELRARQADGRWGPWTLASVQGHDSDNHSGPAPACFGEPVWTGPAAQLQLRANRRVRGLSLHIVAARIQDQLGAGGPDPARPGNHASRAGAGDGSRAPRQAGVAALQRSSPVPSRSAGTGAYPLAQPILPAGPGQPPIIARRAWAGNAGPASPPQYGHVALMFVHHSVNANGYSAAQVPAMLLSIYEFHRYVRGWNDIGYNFAIDAFGRTWEARAGGIDQAVVGAQAGGYNLESTGVVMLGTFSDVLPTNAALDALKRLLAWKLSLHGVPVSGPVTVEVDPPDAYWTPFAPGQHVQLTRISGHRQGCTTDCPGNALFAHLPVVREQVHQLVGSSQLKLSLGLPAAPRVTAPNYLTPAEDRLQAGQPVTLTGRLIRQSATGIPGAPVAGATVEIQGLSGQREEIPAGADGPLDSVQTAADGSFSAQFSPQRNLLVRALAPTAPAVASPLISLAVAPALTLAQTASDPLTLSGTVTPHKARLTLEIHGAAGGHKLVGTETFEVPADGAFSLRPKLRPGRYLIRVISAADADNVAGASPRLEISV